MAQKNMQAQDVAVIFYAGHGLNKKGNFFLCPIDTNFDDPEKTAIADDEIKKRLADMPGRILVMLDACHSGATGVPRRSAGARPSATTTAGSS